MEPQKNTLKWVLVKDNSDKMAMVNLKKDRRVRWKPKVFFDGTKIPQDQLPGYFRVDRKDLINVTDEILAAEQSNLILEQTNIENGGNARIDPNTNLQKLTDVDIKQLRQELAGEEMIEELTKNNENFDKRTEYSKQKYLQRKKEKYLTNLFIQKPTLASAFEFMISTNAKQNIFLRDDAFNLFCQLSEVKEDSRVFCVEKSKGLLLSYIVRILNSSLQGHVYVADYASDSFSKNNYKCLEYLGLNQKCTEVLSALDPVTALTLDQKQELKFTHVLLATNYWHEQIIESTVANLLPNGRLVIYSRMKEQLEKIANLLFKTSCFVNIEICDSFYRKMQVLSNRTHPDMCGLVFSGYILTAYKGVDLNNQISSDSFRDLVKQFGNFTENADVVGGEVAGD